MKGETLSYEDFAIYPEYCSISYEELRRISSKDSRFHIATLPVSGFNMGVVFYRGRNIVSRPKYRLHSSEDITPGMSPPVVFKLGSKKVLILICYEILFPEDYLSLSERVDLVVHMVGVPMFNEDQREGWVALQKVISLIYKCPVVCCCGGEIGRMNITGITR